VEQNLVDGREWEEGSGTYDSVLGEVRLESSLVDGDSEGRDVKVVSRVVSSSSSGRSIQAKVEENETKVSSLSLQVQSLKRRKERKKRRERTHPRPRPESTSILLPGEALLCLRSATGDLRPPSSRSPPRRGEADRSLYPPEAGSSRREEE